MNRPRFFFSTVNAAKKLGVSTRTIGRVSADHGIEPIKIEARVTKHFWTLPQLGEIRGHLKTS